MRHSVGQMREMIRRRGIYILVLSVTFSLTSAQESLGSFLGEQVRYDYLYPDAATVWESATFLIGEGPEFTTGTSLHSVLDLGATDIVIGPHTGLLGNNTGYFTPAAFNGYSFTGHSDSIPDILSVSINPATTVVGVDAQRISVTRDSVRIDLSGLYVQRDHILRLDVTFAPEPTALLLLALGGLAMMRKRRGTAA